MSVCGIPCRRIPHRYVIVLVLWLYGVALPGYGFSSMNIAMMCMVNIGPESSGCPTANLTWSRTVQATVLAGYNYGACLTVLLSGVAADWIGTKTLLLVGSALGFVSTAFLPVAAIHGGWGFVLVLRMMTGAAGATTWPVLARAISLWLLEGEQATALGFITSGHSLGSFVLISGAGYICCKWTWQAIFYSAAVMNLLTFVCTAIYYQSRPEKCAAISDDEKALIFKGRGEKQLLVEAKKPPKVPWVKILTSMPAIAVILCHYVERTTQVFNLMIMPLYMREVLHVRQDQIGLDVGLPVVGQVAGRALAGLLCEATLKYFRSLTRLTKVFNTVGFVCFALLYLGAMQIPASKHHLLILTALGQYLLGSLVIGGFMKAAISISPRFSGIIYGLMITFAYISAIILPYLTQAMTDGGTQKQWNGVFLVVISLCILAPIVFLAMGTAETQSWNAIQMPNDVQIENYGACSSSASEVNSFIQSSDIVDAVR